MIQTPPRCTFHTLNIQLHEPRCLPVPIPLPQYFGPDSLQKLVVPVLVVLAAPSASTVAHSDSVQSELEDLPIEVEEAQSLPAEVPATPSVIEAVKHLDYTGSPADSAHFRRSPFTDPKP